MEATSSSETLKGSRVAMGIRNLQQVSHQSLCSFKVYDVLSPYFTIFLKLESRISTGGGFKGRISEGFLSSRFQPLLGLRLDGNDSSQIVEI